MNSSQLITSSSGKKATCRQILAVIKKIVLVKINGEKFPILLEIGLPILFGYLISSLSEDFECDPVKARQDAQDWHDARIEEGEEDVEPMMPEEYDYCITARMW